MITLNELEKIEQRWKAAIEKADSLDTLEDIRVKALGKKGEVSGLMRFLGQMSADEKREMGPRLNTLRDDINALITEKRDLLEQKALNIQLQAERQDMSLPVRERPLGRIHPVSQVMDELSEVFASLGFEVAEGPDIEDDFHNFTALNIPPEHPARQMHDTFYLPEDGEGNRKVLRTHTSPVQIRTMLSKKPPIRIIAPGRTYRSDSDATHTPMFHQVEALVIDENTHMGHLKGCIEAFVKGFFELDDIDMRFRPSYFPFTEPSAEVDIRCSFEGGKINLGTGDDWLEIMGCGMVHPKVIAACNLDPTRYQGFALGCGIDRLAMLKYGMNDLRAFFDSDMRWMKHYGFLPLHVPTISGGLS